MDKIAQYLPDINSLPIIIECEKMGMPSELIKTLLKKQEIHISGEIYSSRHFKSFKVENLKLSIEENKIEKVKILKIEGIQSQEWLEEKCKEGLRNNFSRNEEVNNRKLSR